MSEWDRLRWFIYGYATYAFFVEDQIERWATSLVLFIVFVLSIYALYRDIKGRR